MSDFHHNIFYYYRGANLSDNDRERQLENNSTKALINTLMLSEQPLGHRFLDWFGILYEGKVNYTMQKETIGDGLIKGKPNRLLLAILPERGDYQPSTESSSGDKNKSIPDTWIWGDDFVILIESKVVGYVDPSQMQIHFNKLKSTSKKLPTYQEVTWADIHKFFLGLLPDLRGRSSWLVKQFNQYLEWNSMTDFVGFEKEVFDYFISDRDHDTRRWVFETFSSFAKEISVRLKQVDSFYEDYDVGVLHQKDDYCWSAFGLKDKSYRQYAHQTIEIGINGIAILVNVELKHATDRLKHKILDDKEGFRNTINFIKPNHPFYIQLEERKNRQVNIFDYHTIAKLESSYLLDSDLGSEGFGYIENVVTKINLPYFTVRKHISREQVIKLSQKDQGKTLIDNFVDVMKHFHPLVEYINN